MQDSRLWGFVLTMIDNQPRPLKDLPHNSHCSEPRPGPELSMYLKFALSCFVGIPEPGRRETRYFVSGMVLFGSPVFSLGHA